VSSFPLTPDQHSAATTTGRNVIVSASAGSGKTTVIAQRCVHLVCDAPAPHRCNADALLVLTFTEAAAGEMRARIVHALQERARLAPADQRLQDQAALAETARISTIHSFCRWVIERWFNEAGIDPAAAIMDEDEAALLQRDVLDALFEQLYSRMEHDTASTGGAEPAAAADSADQGAVPLAEGFARLVDDYGLGRDNEIAALVLRLARFTESLVDPDQWLADAVASVSSNASRTVGALAAAMRQEIERQREDCILRMRRIRGGPEVGWFFADRIEGYIRQLAEWVGGLRSPGQAESMLPRFDAVRRAIDEYVPDKTRTPPLSRDTAEDVRAARDDARDLWQAVKEKLFGVRLRARFGRFSPVEWLAGLRAVHPYVRTIVGFVQAFRRAYQQRKRRLGLLDFADLERLAYRVLSADGRPEHPSPAAIVVRRRFAHVLVDEFQDVNPLQEAILRLAARDPAAGDGGNLFVVGDVKQSIYRFRLAEPAVFLAHLAGAADGSSGWRLIPLLRNFRSRREIIDAVNVIFRAIMTPALGGIGYDAQSELSTDRPQAEDGRRLPVEVHLLERNWGTATAPGAADEDVPPTEDGTDTAPAGQTEDDRPSAHALGDPARWTSIQREAYVVAARIRELVDDPAEDLRYADVAVLLRAARVNAAQMVEVFNWMGVPAYTPSGGALLQRREVRDVVAALQVLDNPRQDIPLVGVLRGGMFGGPFSADELVTIRMMDRQVPFHECFHRYLTVGNDAALRERLRDVAACIDRFRRDARRRPLADVLWALYEHSGQLAYASGLPHGAQRRANLLMLHERARQFGNFRRQGLLRFLRFLEAMDEERRALSAAPALGEAENVVRVISIHQSKGLEFPVVFLAGLGTKLNLGDRNGSMLFERECGIGLRVVDPERLIVYPSATHLLAVAEIERQTRAEELRVLYVAMTRAKQRLFLVGSLPGAINRCRAVTVREQPACDDGQELAPSTLALASATSPLDWLLPVLGSQPPGIVAWPWTPHPPDSLFRVHTHEVDEMSAWRLPRLSLGDDPVLAAVATLGALPPAEPRSPDHPLVEEVTHRLDYVYPMLTSASVRAVWPVSAFQGTYDYLSDPETRREASGREREPRRMAEFTFTPSRYEPRGSLDPMDRGTLTHRVLQCLDFSAATDARGLASELQRMEAEGRLAAVETAALDRDALLWFVSTPLAASIRSAARAYRREFPFVMSLTPGLFDPAATNLTDDHVLVRGIVDGILPVDGGHALVDYKTDAVTGDGALERARSYRPQLMLYALAGERLFGRPVPMAYVVFLSARTTVVIDEPGRENAAVRPATEPPSPGKRVPE
jgi:ATP-dependent helicase/nuclease subunit A